MPGELKIITNLSGDTSINRDKVTGTLSSNRETIKDVSLKNKMSMAVTIGSQKGSMSSSIESSDNISGAIQRQNNIVGTINSKSAGNPYEGPYEVVPKRKQVQILDTTNKRMKGDVTVFEIPEYEVGNPYGTTFIIGGNT